MTHQARFPVLHHALTKLVPGAIAINLLLNYVLGKLVYGHLPIMPFTGDTSVTGDTLVGAFLIGFFTFLLAAPAARKEAKAGRLPGRGSKGLFAWAETSPGWSSFVFGLLMAILLGGTALAVLGPRVGKGMDIGSFLAFKALFSGAVGGIAAFFSALIGVRSGPVPYEDVRWCREPDALVDGPVYPCDYIDKGGIGVTNESRGCSGTPTWQLVVQGSLDPAHVRTALEDTITRYPALTTIVQSLDGYPEYATHFRYAPNPNFSIDRIFEVVDLRGKSYDALEAVIIEVHNRHTDQFVDPPMTLTMAMTHDDQCRLLFRQHHGIADGRAFIELLTDFSEYLEAARQGRRPPKIEPVQRRGEVEALGLHQGEIFRYTLEGFRWFGASLLRGKFRPPTPLIQNDSNDYTGANGTLHWVISDEALAAWKKSQKSIGVSLNSLLTAAIYEANRKWHKEQGRAVGETVGTLVMETRPRQGYFRSFANHLATLEVMVDLDQDISVEDIARSIQAQVVEQRDLKIPTKRLLAERILVLGMSMDRVQSHVFEKKYANDNLNFSNLIPLAIPTLGGQGWHAAEILITTPITPRHGIVFTVIRYHGKIIFNINYKESAATREQASALFCHFRDILEQITGYAPVVQPTAAGAPDQPAEKGLFHVEFEAYSLPASGEEGDESSKSPVSSIKPSSENRVAEKTSQIEVSKQAVGAKHMSPKTDKPSVEHSHKQDERGESEALTSDEMAEKGAEKPVSTEESQIPSEAPAKKLTLFQRVPWRVWLSHPKLPLWLGLLAIFMTLSTLSIGIVLDDQLQWLKVDGRHSPHFSAARPLDLFHFISDDNRKPLFESGAYPWWSAPKLQLAFFRPLSSLTHWLEYRFYPQYPLLMHIHSLLWFALLMFLVTILYRRMLPTALIGGIAAFLYTVDEAHALSSAWLANRNALIATSLAVLTLIAHDKWRRDGWKWGAFFAPLCLALGLLAAEFALFVTGYLFAYCAFLEKEKSWKRWMPLVPYGILVVAWRIAYKALGYGAIQSGGYIDPLGEPVRFFFAVCERLPTLLFAQWTVMSADFWMTNSHLHNVIHAAIGAFVILLITWILWPLFRKDATARFWALGMLLAALPICATFPHDRVLFGIGIGAMGLIGQLFGIRYIEHSDHPEHRGNAASRKPLAIQVRVLCGFFLVFHVHLAPLFLPLKAISPYFLERLEKRSFDSIPHTPDLAKKQVFLVHTPGFLAHTMFAMYALRNQPQPKVLRQLSITLKALKVTRLDAQTIRLDAEDELVDRSTQMLVLSTGLPFRVGQVFRYPDVAVTVKKLAKSGRPSSAEFRFAKPLESASYVWMTWKGSGFAPFAPPAVGKSIQLKALSTTDIFL